MTDTITLSSGTKMPVFGLGTWNSPPHVTGAAVKLALLDNGYHHIDCASIYGNEAEVGQAFAEVFAGKKVKRADVFVTSKLWNTNHHPDNVLKACQQTLHDLQLEYLDLYLVHWGVAFKQGKDKEPVGKDGWVMTEPVSMQETWRAMEQLVEKGLVKNIGVSNFTVGMLVDLLSYAKIKPAMNQVELHPYNAQTGLLTFCHHHGIAVTAYSPLGSPGTAQPGQVVLLEEPVVEKIATAHQKTPAHILLRWGIQRQTVVIPKTTSADRIKSNIDIFDFELSEDEMAALNKLDRHHRYVNPTRWWGLSYFS